jgi:phage-related baseplate assembly protein
MIDVSQIFQNQDETQSYSDAAFVRPRDLVLEEVYRVKARLNAEANYSVEKILERARKNAATWRTS